MVMECHLFALFVEHKTIHRDLEQSLSSFLGQEDCILYSSCFDANTGLFETLFNSEDAIISDELNHASIIDGIRLCKAQRLRYKNRNLEDLEEKIKLCQNSRHKIICTDGVFSMDGSYAPLKEICDLADKYGCLVMVDDSHAVGFIGRSGQGSIELMEVSQRIDILTGTLGKALGGASGGYTAASKNIIKYLRQKSRPYLFSNSLSPVITCTSIEAIKLLSESDELRNKLQHNSRYFREALQDKGFELVPGEHPIIPVMVKDAKKAQMIAKELLEKNIYVIGFSFPVVPKIELE